MVDHFNNDRYIALAVTKENIELRGELKKSNDFNATLLKQLKDQQEKMEAMNKELVRTHLRLERKNHELNNMKNLYNSSPYKQDDLAFNNHLNIKVNLKKLNNIVPI